jgi:N,N'-diacetyllegionaminate synthase
MRYFRPFKITSKSKIVDPTFNWDENKTFIVAEVGLSHEGSLGQAYAFIDALAEVGVDAIKFQTHFASAESTLDERFRVQFSRQDSSRFAYWQRTSFTENQWRELFEYCKSKGIRFISSPFSSYAAELLDNIGMSIWKLGSGQVFDSEMLEYVLKHPKPTILSTGLANTSELDNLYRKLSKSGCPLCILQCTSEYPVSLDRVGLNLIVEYKKRYECAVGLSDHSATVFPAVAAISMGVSVVEVHATFDRRMFGPDVRSSLLIDEIKFLVDYRNAFAIMKESSVSGNKIDGTTLGMREIFGRSLALREKRPKGYQIKENDLCLKKPGSGIPEENKSKLIGSILKRDKPADQLLRMDDFES